MCQSKSGSEFDFEVLVLVDVPLSVSREPHEALLADWFVVPLDVDGAFSGQTVETARAHEMQLAPF